MNIELLFKIYAWFSVIQNVGFAWLSILLLAKLLREVKFFEREFGLARSELPSPGISILVSLKGNLQVVSEGLMNLLHQDYNGPIEMIFITESSTDAAVTTLRPIFEKEQSKATVKWVYDRKLEGSNPRTAKMLAGYQESSHNWVYWTSPDTLVTRDHLKKMMYKTKGDPKKFATSIPLQYGSQNLWSLLENVSFVWGIVSFFLLNRLLKKPQVYGGSVLFHKDLLKDEKSLLPLADYLTEEVPLTDAFIRNGGVVQLVPSWAYVKQEIESFDELYQRNLRWMMIVKYHHKQVYFGCIAYSFIWLVILAILTGDNLYWQMTVLFLVSKGSVNLIYHIMLKFPLKQTMGAFLIPIYEFFVVVFSFHSLFKRKINWRGDIIHVSSRGILTREASSQL